MLDGAGNLCSHRSSIAEVFASFYEQLYGSLTHTGECDLLPGISVAATLTEVRQAVKHLKNNKACAADGLVAEMLKHGGERGRGAGGLVGRLRVQAVGGGLVGAITKVVS